MSARLELVAYLQTVIADVDGLRDVRVIPSSRSIDEPSTPLLIVKTDAYARLPEAPHKVAAQFTLALVSPHQDMDLAEKDLEERLELLLPRLFTAGLLWGEATQTGWTDSRLAFDITLTSLLT